MGMEQMSGARAPWTRRVARVVATAAVLVTVATSVCGAQPAAQGSTGVLILAHGGSQGWNSQVADLATRVNAQLPAEVAFGMADRSTIQAAVDRLVRRGVGRIVAVPLFVSSHSSVFESSRYLLGARPDAPADLAIFARMKHGDMSSGDRHHGAGDPAAMIAPAVDGTTPVVAPVPVVVGRALDHDPAVAAILAERAKSLSHDPASEVVVIVAHGPTSDEENALWVKDMELLAAGVQQAAPFARVESLTVRDDAPAPIRDAAAAHLRDVVSKATGEGHRVLIVPLLLSYGGIETGVRKRLDGLDYQMAAQGLLPDDRLVQWVIDSARAPDAISSR